MSEEQQIPPPRSLWKRVEVAHREIQAAQEQAYASNLDGRPHARLLTRVALNRVEAILMKLLTRSAQGKRL